MSLAYERPCLKLQCKVDSLNCQTMSLAMYHGYERPCEATVKCHECQTMSMAMDDH